MKKYEVIFYEKQNGECPIEEFLNAIEKKTRKPPKKEIEKAKEFRKDFVERWQRNEKIR